MKKSHLYLITFAYGFSMFAQGILTPIYAFFIQKIGGGILETSWAVALYSIVTGIGTILIHKTALSHNHKSLFLLGGWFLWLLSVGAYLIMTNIYVMYLSQILSGIGIAMSEPIFDAEFTEKIADDLSGGWSLFAGATHIFSGIAALAGGFIVSWYGFNVLIYCMFFVATLSFLMIVYYTNTQKNA